MKTLGVITARYNSTRFPGKPIVKIYGLPMVKRVWRRAQGCSMLDDVIVATDDYRVYETCTQHMVKSIMTAQHETSTERMAEVSDQIEADIYVNIHGNEPVINPEDIDKIVKFIKENNDAAVSTMIKTAECITPSHP